MATKQLTNTIKKYEAILDTLKDPYLNMRLVHPDTPLLRHRILSNTVLRGYYRPDLYRKNWTCVPNKEEVDAVFNDILKDLHEDVVWRTCYLSGVYYRHKSKDILLDHLCIALFSRFTKADVLPEEEI